VYNSLENMEKEWFRRVFIRSSQHFRKL